ncbi:MAG: hypothetical protein ABR607_03625 [Pyrinomonadaceae bacterium]
MPRLQNREAFETRTRTVLVLCSFAIAGLVLLAGCSAAGGGNGLHVKSATTGDKDLPVKSSYAFAVTKSFTDISGKITTASAYNVFVANYDLDANNFAMTLDKPLTSDDRLRVVFSLIGDQGADEKSPPKAGTYLAKAGKFMKVESAGIVARRGGADVKSWLDRSALSGEVKVTSASADEISGDLDLTSGDSSIKGSFTAKVLKRK